MMLQNSPQLQNYGSFPLATVTHFGCMLRHVCELCRVSPN